MKQYIHFFLLLLSPFIIAAQTGTAHRVHVAVFNAGTAMPFSNVGKLISGPYHPGIEIGGGFNWATRKRHDWFQDFNIAYFSHRFVQHAIPLNTELGYRYKFPQILSLHASVGAGYLHSIPATGVYKRSADGRYSSSKGIGRPQGNATLALGVGLHSKQTANRQFEIFIDYKERFQFPFVKSYVPVLPYNNLLLGVSLSFKNHHH